MDTLIHARLVKARLLKGPTDRDAGQADRSVGPDFREGRLIERACLFWGGRWGQTLFSVSDMIEIAGQTH